MPWANPKPVKIETCPDGRIARTMADGQVLTGPARATYLLTYMSYEPGTTFNVEVSIVGLCPKPGYMRTWNHGIDEVRSYAFHKIVRLTDLRSGLVSTGAQACADLGGEMLK